MHRALDPLLEEWWESGWGALYGRAPRLDDYIVPRSIDGERTYGDADDDTDEGIEHDDLWPADQINKLFHADLDALGIHRRRCHDLRRTFITLAREDGARADVLEVITHAPNPETTTPSDTRPRSSAKATLWSPPRHVGREDLSAQSL